MPAASGGADAPARTVLAMRASKETIMPTASGHWHRRGGALVIDLASQPQYSQQYSQWQGEVPPSRARAAADLEPARKELKAILKERTALKPFATLGPDAQPFMDAFTALRAKSEKAADRYTAAANATTIPARTTLAETKKLLTAYLEDMTELQDWAKITSTAGATSPFGNAFAAARDKAKLLATRYAAQLGSTP
jgi:hypothetical protein